MLTDLCTNISDLHLYGAPPPPPKKKKTTLFGLHKEGITKCSNEVYTEFTDIRQHNKYLYWWSDDDLLTG